MIKISIVMPVYNAEKTIQKSIESLINQTYSNWELIAVDDGSIDNSYEILTKYSIKDSRIQVFHQDNKGPGAARNVALKQASGDYYAFLDADDFWVGDFLQIVVQKIKQENADIIFYDLIHETQNGSFIKYSRLSDFAFEDKQTLIRLQMTGKMQWGMVKVIKRKLVVENSLFFTHDSVGEEAVFSFNVLKFAEKISFIDKPLYHYVQTVHGQHTKGDLDPWGAIVDKLKSHLLQKNAYNQYRKTINSFALRALCISCYRCATNKKISIARQLMKNQIKVYKKNYTFKSTELDFLALDKSSKILRFFIRIEWLLPIILLSKIRKSYR